MGLVVKLIIILDSDIPPFSIAYPKQIIVLSSVLLKTVTMRER